jgi:hypothetical protein
VAMESDHPVLVEDTDVHGPRMQVDTTVKLGLLGVESPAVSSSCECLLPRRSIPPGSAGEGASISINRLREVTFWRWHMKQIFRWKIVRWILLGILLILVTIQFVPIDRLNPPVEGEVPAPANVRVILRRSLL